MLLAIIVASVSTVLFDGNCESTLREGIARTAGFTHQLDADMPRKVLQNGVNVGKDCVEKCYAKFSNIPAAPMPPPTHIVTMP